MRTHGAWLSAGLFGALSSALRSPVYVSGPSVQPQQTGSDTPSISLNNARLFFAQRVGVAGDYSLDGADEATFALLNQVQEASQRLFAPQESSNPRRTLVIVEGVDNPEELLSSQVRPHFYIDQTPSADESFHTVSTLLGQDRDRRDAHEICGSWINTMEIKDSIQGGFSAGDPLGTCNLDSIHKGSWWKGLSLAGKFDVVNRPISDITSKVYQKQVAAWRLSDITGIFHFWTLHELAEESGISSPEYIQAREALRKSLAKLHASGGETTIVLSPYVRGGIPQRSSPIVNQKRADFPIEAAAESSSPAATSFPRTTIASCYTDESACVSATANCSGHGACTLRWTETDSDDEKGAECWACVCQISVLEAGDSNGVGRRTIAWGGPACQKKDISIQFWMFAGLTIALVSMVSYGIGMLYSIGDAELPSVLGAGVTSVGARGK